MTGAVLSGADLTGLDDEIWVLVEDELRLYRRLGGKEAVGYLRFQGAATDPVDLHYVLRHHPKFGVIRKVCDKLREQSWRQRRGLTQRGAARQDPKLARNFLAFLE